LEHRLEKYLEARLQKEPSYINRLNDYSLSKIPEKDLLKLPLREKENLLEKCGTVFHFKPEFLSKFLLTFEAEKQKDRKTYSLEKKILE
jgi:hypothetical protein